MGLRFKTESHENGVPWRSRCGEHAEMIFISVGDREENIYFILEGTYLGTAGTALFLKKKNHIVMKGGMTRIPWGAIRASRLMRVESPQSPALVL